MNSVDAIRMQAAGKCGTYVVTVTVNDGRCFEIKTIGQVPEKVKHSMKFFSERCGANADWLAYVIKDEMEKNGKFIGAAR